MNTTYSTIDRVYGLLAESDKRTINNARALGHMQGTALGVIYLLQNALNQGSMSDSVKASVKNAIDQLQKAAEATQDPHAFGKGMD